MKLTQRQEAILKRTFIDYNQTAQFLENPLVIGKAEGLYCWDVEGKRYFDAIGGIFVASLGHRHPRVVEAVRKQLDKLTFAPPLHSVSDVTLDYIDRLGATAPDNLKYVKPFSGGSEAIESSLKFVRQYFKQSGKPEKTKCIGRYQAFHGSTLAAVSASGNTHRKVKSEPLVPGFLKAPSPITLRDRFSSWEECNRFAAQTFDDIIINEGPNTVAAVLVEPIGNLGGVMTPTDEYYRILRQICDRHDVMLIFDEVITFAKTGAMFAAQTYQVTPDIICGGKGLGSGVVPLSAMIAREDMADVFFGPADQNLEFAHGHTFAGNPLACAAGLAVLDEIDEKNLNQKARELGDYLNRRLSALQKYGVVREVRGKGIWRGVELVKDTTSNTPFPQLGRALKQAALKNGLIMRIDPDWFSVAPPLIATASDIDEMCDLVDRSLAEALRLVS
jgi:adenosylmethionine-8-amino-7-oxononanoate aminotransferase